MHSQTGWPKGNPTRKVSIRDVVVSIAEGRAIGACDEFEKEGQYRIEHFYANDSSGKEHASIFTRRADGENYDPFVLVLPETEIDKKLILRTCWAYSRNNAQRGGSSLGF